MSLANASPTCTCGPHAACAHCDAPLHYDRIRKRYLDAHEVYQPHRCPPPAPERVLECVCGLIVWLQADGRKLLHPSRAVHRPHYVGPEAGFARWLAVEERRAELATAPAAVTR